MYLTWRSYLKFIPTKVTLAVSASLLSASVIGLEDKHLSLEQQLRPQQGQSVDEIARQIRRDNNWRILAAEPRVQEQKTIYRFKLLNRKRGRVQVIEVDPIKPNLTPLQ